MTRPGSAWWRLTGSTTSGRSATSTSWKEGGRAQRLARHHGGRPHALGHARQGLLRERPPAHGLCRRRGRRRAQRHRRDPASRDSLVADGHDFSSETDAEVVAHLVERHYTGDLVEAVRATYIELEGHFAFGRCAPRASWDARRRPPAVPARRRRRRQRDVPGSFDRCVPARDAPREADRGRRGRRDHVRRRALLPGRRRPHDRDFMEVDWDDEDAEKQGYETFMLKEIYEQPQAVADTIGERCGEPARPRGHRPLESEIQNLRRMGSSLAERRTMPASSAAMWSRSGRAFRASRTSRASGSTGTRCSPRTPSWASRSPVRPRDRSRL